jgi:hypothetical protein
MGSKMTVDFERFPVLFNVTENVAAVEFDHLLNMTPHHRRQIASPVADTHVDHKIVLPMMCDLVPSAVRSVYTTIIHSRAREHDGCALCPIQDVSFVQIILHCNLQFDRSLFISMLLLAFLGSLFEWDNNSSHEGPKAFFGEAFCLLVPPAACNHEELILSESSFRSPPMATNDNRTRRTVSWNLDFKVREIPRLSQQEKIERKNHFFKTVTWSTKNAVSIGEII